MLGPFAANTVLSNYACQDWSCGHKFNHAGSGVILKKPGLAERLHDYTEKVREQHPEITPEYEERMYKYTLAGVITGLTVLVGLIFFLP